MLDHFFREVTDRSDDGILALQAVRDEDTGDVTDFLVLYANERAQDSMMCFRQGDMTHSTQGSVGSPKDNCKCELVGTKLCEQFPEHRAPNGLFPVYREVLLSGRPFRREFWYEPREGVRSYLRHRTEKLECIDGVCVRFEDVSARKSAEMDMERAIAAKDQAIEASRAKSAFLTSMSHELRTPLNCIIGMCDWLTMRLGKRACMDKEELDGLLLVKDQGNMLLALLSSILDMSKLEADAMLFESEPFDLAGAVQSVVSSFAAPGANQSAVPIIVNQEACAPRTVVGDSTRVKQVLLNLIGNAIKFTKQGRVLVNITELRGMVLDSEPEPIGFKPTVSATWRAPAPYVHKHSKSAATRAYARPAPASLSPALMARRGTPDSPPSQPFSLANQDTRRICARAPHVLSCLRNSDKGTQTHTPRCQSTTSQTASVCGGVTREGEKENQKKQRGESDRQRAQGKLERQQGEEAGDKQQSTEHNSSTNGSVFLFTIEDSGCGLKAEQASVIFEPFVQGDMSVTRVHGGVGLGLSLSKKLVAQLGGMVGVKSCPGKGSLFWFTLPLGKAKGKVQKETEKGDSIPENTEQNICPSSSRSPPSPSSSSSSEPEPSSSAIASRTESSSTPMRPFSLSESDSSDAIASAPSPSSSASSYSSPVCMSSPIRPSLSTASLISLEAAPDTNQHITDEPINEQPMTSQPTQTSVESTQPIANSSIQPINDQLVTMHPQPSSQPITNNLIAIVQHNDQQPISDAARDQCACRASISSTSSSFSSSSSSSLSSSSLSSSSSSSFSSSFSHPNPLSLEPVLTKLSVPLQVMVVDDSKMNRMVLSRMLHALGLTPAAQAEDGVACLLAVTGSVRATRSVITQQGFMNNEVEARLRDMETHETQGQIQTEKGEKACEQTKRESGVTERDTQVQKQAQSEEQTDRESKRWLIFMDYLMPVMAGDTCSRLVRSLALPNRPIIIALTACAFSEDRDRCFEAGCDAYLQKPCSLNILRETVAKVLETVESDTKP